MKNWNTVADLIAASFGSTGQLTSTKGYTTAGDGGAATYMIKTAAQAAADGDTIDEIGAGFTLADTKVAVLQYTQEGVFNIAQFGDNQAAFDAIETSSIQGDELQLNGTSYTANIVTAKTPVRGVGASTVLTSANTTPAMTLKRHTPDWDYYKVSNLTIDGNARAANCAEFDPANQLAGRWAFDNVQFANADIGVNKPQGNIGDNYTGCTYTNSNFGHKAVGATLGTMHVGATSWTNSHWDTIDTACIALDDSTAGLGAISINQCIMESCAGIGYFAKLDGVTPYIPPVIDQLWMEGIATAPTVTIDSVVYTAREIYLEGVVYQEIRNTYLNSMQLVSSKVVARGCRIDDAKAFPDFDFDDDSILFVDDLYANGTVTGTPFVRSIANQISVSENKQLSVRGPLMTSQMDIANYGHATNIASNSYSGTGPWNFQGTGTIGATSVADGVLNATCGELTVPANFTLQGDQLGTPTTGKWCVWSIHAKLISGVLGFSAMSSGIMLGSVYLETGKWIRSYGIQKIAVTNVVRLRFEESTGAEAVVRFADQTCVEFDKFIDAIEYCNSMTSLKNEV